MECLYCVEKGAMTVAVGGQKKIGPAKRREGPKNSRRKKEIKNFKVGRRGAGKIKKENLEAI